MLDRNIFQAFEKLFVVYRAQLWEVSQKHKLSPIMIQFLNYLSYLKHGQEQRNTVSLSFLRIFTNQSYSK